MLKNPNDTSQAEMIAILKRIDRSFSAAASMFQSISNSQAIENKLIVELIEDMKHYRQHREEKEDQGITAKFNAVINQRFGLLWWFLDKIAPGVGLALVLALLKFLHII